MLAGAVFLPPEVTMISFLRPVMCAKPSPSSMPTSPVCSHPSCSSSAVAAASLK